MAREVQRLGALDVRRKSEPGYYPDGAGLYLRIAAGGSRQWIYRFRLDGARHDMGLGSADTFTLVEARERASAARKLSADGINPIARRAGERSALAAAAARAVTFKQAATAYIEAQGPAWRNDKHRLQWESTLATYVYPKLGAVPVESIEPEHVLAVLRQPVDGADKAVTFWTAKTETASRVRQRIETIIGSVDSTRPNPARWKGNLATKLPKPTAVAKVDHHKAIPIDDMPAFMVALRQQAGLGARALELAILTACRSGEVRCARWDEFDLDAGVWTIPPERMKAHREHRVPLSEPARALLRSLPVDETGLVFPSTRGTPLSDMTLSAVMRRMNVGAVPHGMRSTFRDWAAERTNHPHEVAEMALAHAVGSKTEAAYRRGDLLPKRAAIMADWAAFLERPTTRAAVVPIGAKTRAAGEN